MRPRGVLFSATTAPTIAAVRGATALGDWNENRRHSAGERRDIDRTGLRPNARKGREALPVGAADRRAEAEGGRGGEGIQSRARSDTGQKEIRPVGQCALGAGFGSARGARRPRPTYRGNDPLGGGGEGAGGEGRARCERGQMGGGAGGRGRPLIRHARTPGRGREARKVIDTAGEGGAPLEPPPLPDRLVDVNRAL